LDRVIEAGQIDENAAMRFNENLALVRSPQTLLAPSFVLRVLARARTAHRVRQRNDMLASTEQAAISASRS
jgi:hypothetical protein